MIVWSPRASVELATGGGEQNLLASSCSRATRLLELKRVLFFCISRVCSPNLNMLRFLWEHSQALTLMLSQLWSLSHSSHYLQERYIVLQLAVSFKSRES